MSDTKYKYIPCLICSTLNRIKVEKINQPAKCGKCKMGLDTQSPVFDVNFATLENVIANSPVPVLVDFWAPWCGPCQGFAPVYKQVAQSNPFNALYLKFNTDKEKEMSMKFNIRGIPLIIAFENGVEKIRQSGAMPLHIFEGWLKNAGII